MKNLKYEILVFGMGNVLIYYRHIKGDNKYTRSIWKVVLALWKKHKDNSLLLSYLTGGVFYVKRKEVKG